MPTTNTLTLEQTRKVARLSRLALTDDQLDDHRQGLAAVLGYVDRLSQLNLDNIEPLSNPAEETNRLDDDTPRDPLPPESLTAMAPETFGPFIKVPKVLNDTSSA